MNESLMTPDQRTKLQNALAFAGEQCHRLLARQPELHPMYTVKGSWSHGGERWTHWCEGFYPGIYWLLAQHLGDTTLRAAAETATRRLESRRHDRDVHDLGFLFLNTYLRWFRATGDPALEEVVVAAGRTLALRFQPKGGYLCSFLGPASLFIDIMMNVPVIFYAGMRTADAGLLDIANRHTDTSAERLVRADGSTAHEALFDVDTGRFLRESTQQGLAAHSAWSRGVAWGLYGFGTAYRYSQRAEHLATAERIANYYISKTKDAFVPLWDFDAERDPTAPRLVDSSAAAIAASGLWNLSWLTASAEKGAAYRQHALSTLLRLSEDDYLAQGHPGQEGILLHGVYHLHKRLGVDESVSWGDHFFVEGLVKALSNARTIDL